MTTSARHIVLTLALAVTSALLAPTSTASASASAPAHASRPGPTAGAVAPGTEHGATRRALDRYRAQGVPGAAAQVSGPGGAEWYGSSGSADLRGERPRRSEDRFRIGSITKTFTATLLLQLEARGALSLDDTVDRWLPGLVRGPGGDGREITLRQLLNHTSGLPDYTDTPWFTYVFGEGFPRHRFTAYRPGELVAMALRRPATSRPGAVWAYANTNYVLAGMVIEEAGGAPLRRQLRQRVLTPLGLHATRAAGRSVDLPRPHGRHHTELPDGRIFPATRLDLTAFGAAGDMISTGKDVNAFLRALLGGRLLPPRQQAALLETVPIGTDGSAAYGLGLTRERLSCGVRIWGHGGVLNGSLSWAYSTQDGSRQVTVNLNGDWHANDEPLDQILEAEFCPAGAESG
ncbi:serine hydrolase domain-containing protein [Streptomyces sp. NPDC059816]|uniref:serine hydrolase domain-containing protein n=1 Tax=Streptomyces sp. NPDC059816 TaxID=3346960 RepID=UPI003655E031